MGRLDVCPSSLCIMLLSFLFQFARMLQLLIKDLHLIPFFLQPLYAFGKSSLEFVYAAQRIVKRDDGAIADILLHIVHHILRREVPGIVACHQIPHDNGVVATYMDILSVLHPSTRRTEEIGMDIAVGLIGIAEESLARHSDAAKMIECVIAQAMPTATYLFIQFGILPHIVTYHEECGLHAITVEGVEQPWSRLWYRAIVKRQINRFLIRIHPPYCTGIKPSQPLARLFYYHIVINTQLAPFRSA